MDAPLMCLQLYPLRASQDISIFNFDAIIREENKSGSRVISQVILDKMFHILERLHCLRGEFDILYDLMNKRIGDVNPLKNKVERLIQYTNDLKDQQEIYSNWMIIKVQGSRHIEISNKLKEVSNRLDAEGTYHKEIMAKLE